VEFNNKVLYFGSIILIFNVIIPELYRQACTHWPGQVLWFILLSW